MSYTYGGYNKPKVTVEQIIMAANPVLLNPQLPAMIMGPCYQVLQKESTATEYDWTLGNNTVAYPSLLVGATVDTENSPFKPEVYIKTKLSTGAFREYLIDDSDITLHAINLDIAPELIKDLMLWSAAYKGTVNAAETMLEDVDLTFFDYDVKPGDQINLDGTGTLWIDITGVTGSKIYATLTGNAGENKQYAIRRKLGGTSSDIMISYRAQRSDIVATGIQLCSSIDDIIAKWGTITYLNPIAMGVYFALNNTISGVYGIAVDDTIAGTDSTKWSDALFTIGTNANIYSIVSLTQNTTINGLVKSHVVNYSQKEVGRERIGFINRVLPEYGQKLDPPGSKKGAYDILDSKFVVKEDITASIDPGNSVLDVSSGSNEYRLIIGKVYANLVSEITLQNGPLMSNLFLLDGVEHTGAYTVVDKTLKILGIDLTASLAAGDWIYDPDDQKIYLIASVTLSGSDTDIVVDDIIDSDYAAPIADIAAWNVKFFNWTVEWIDNAFDKDEQAEQIAIYADSFAERRISLVWPDLFYYDDPVTGVDSILEGFYIGCCVAGMVSAYEPQQGFTNLPFTGPKTLIHSNSYFDDDLPGSQLDHMADGGVYIVVQDAPGALPYCRHQLTTNMATVKEQELQTTRCLDYSAKKYRAGIHDDIGIHNVTPGYISMMIGTLNKISENLLDRGTLTMAQPQIPTISAGGDKVEVIIKTDVPTPLNGIDLILYVG